MLAYRCRYTGHHESAIMRMKLTHITPVLAAGAAALAIAAAPTAAAEPAAAQMTNPSTVVASQVAPAGFHGGGGGFHGGGGGFHGGDFHGGYGGFHGDRGWQPWGWPWGWDRR
jgi:hypothetical protein